MSKSANPVAWANEALQIGAMIGETVLQGEDLLSSPVGCVQNILVALPEVVESMEGLEGTDGAILDSILILCSTFLNAIHYYFRRLYRLFVFIKSEVSFISAILYYCLRLLTLSQLFRLNRWCPREIRVTSDVVEDNSCVLFLCAQID